MVQINMLPWREQARLIKKKNFFVGLAISIGLTLFIIFIFHVYYVDLMGYQDQRNAFLETGISQRQKAIDELRKQKSEQEQIKTKLQFLMGLRERSFQAVLLLNELLKIVPDTITLSKLLREENVITLEGKAQSELAITDFLKSISQAAIFNQPVLTGIHAMPNVETGPERYFQLKVEQRGE